MFVMICFLRFSVILINLTFRCILILMKLLVVLAICVKTSLHNLIPTYINMEKFDDFFVQYLSKLKEDNPFF